MEDELKKMKWKTNSKKNENGRRPQFLLKIEDAFNILTLEDDLNFWKMEDGSTAQLRQFEQYNNQNYIGTNEKINLNWP